ncbi:MAG: cell wall hydrolase [Lachnospiraceae bacterium]|nr:cell wall hydrolase [Lachnospiraceae bacterium]
MKAVLRKRFISGSIATVLVFATVISGNTATAKGDAAFTLSAGSALGTVSKADDMEFVEMNLSAGASGIVEMSYLDNPEEMDEYKEKYEQQLQAERNERYKLAMAKTSDYVNVRTNPNTESDRVGVIYKNCGGDVLERADGWTKIESGEVVGWVSNDYLYLDESAEEYAAQVCKTYANVDTQALRVRTQPGEDTEIIGLLEVGTDLETVQDDNEDDGWTKVLYQGKVGYVSSDYITLSLDIPTGETLEEIEERERLAALEKAKLVTTYTSVTADVDETTLLAAIIQCEAGNQCYEGKLAVGAVVCNRIRSGSYPNNVKDVVYQKGQFTPAHNGMLAKALANGISDSCRQAAAEALTGATNVGNACHFRRSGGREGVTIGDHVFY